MADSVKLPTVNEYGYYEMRLESIGGLGANLCGKMLGELGALYLGLNAASFSSYGSEKRGSPVKSYIRWCAPETELRVNSPVDKPHILGLFHENMAGKTPVTAGVGKDTKIVINTAGTPEETIKLFDIRAGTLYCVDALKSAMETKSRINMVMLGAIAKATGFVELSSVYTLCRETIGKKYPELIERNLAGVRLGFESATPYEIKTDKPEHDADTGTPENRWGYQNAPIGGINPHIGSTVSNDLSASREGYIPLFIPEKCIHCGLCHTTCPDMVFRFTEGEYKGRRAMKNRGLDYHHCKGCLRCVNICPTEALVAGLEREHIKKQHFIRNKDLIASRIDYEDTGANSWITGESYMDEKRPDGGVV
ncbi:MAG: 4Fe-4S binding protein [Clostridiales bacterium]|nr:4Fe-4S binding protein [Clostridiales bacterium]